MIRVERVGNDGSRWPREPGRSCVLFHRLLRSDAFDVMYGQEHEGQSDSMEGIMGAPVRESNDSEPLKNELSKSETPKSQPLKDALKDVSPMPSSRRVEA